MATEDIENKDLVRMVLKDVVVESLGETLLLIKLEVNLFQEINQAQN